MIHRIEIAIRKGLPDPRGKHVAARVREFLDIPIGAVRTRDVYHLEADLQPTQYQAEALAAALVPQASGKRFLLARASRGRA